MCGALPDCADKIRSESKRIVANEKLAKQKLTARIQEVLLEENGKFAHGRETWMI